MVLPATQSSRRVQPTDAETGEETGAANGCDQTGTLGHALCGADPVVLVVAASSSGTTTATFDTLGDPSRDCRPTPESRDNGS